LKVRLKTGLYGNCTGKVLSSFVHEGLSEEKVRCVLAEIFPLPLIKK